MWKIIHPIIIIITTTVLLNWNITTTCVCVCRWKKTWLTLKVCPQTWLRWKRALEPHSPGWRTPRRQSASAESRLLPCAQTSPRRPAWRTPAAGLPWWSTRRTLRTLLKDVHAVSRVFTALPNVFASGVWCYVQTIQNPQLNLNGNEVESRDIADWIKDDALVDTWELRLPTYTVLRISSILEGSTLPMMGGWEEMALSGESSPRCSGARAASGKPNC